MLYALVVIVALIILISCGRAGSQ
eukprot:COSAG06_NODE_13033_length_1300_cov_1.273938_3_plen_23_part_01